MAGEDPTHKGPTKRGGPRRGPTPPRGGPHALGASERRLPGLAFTRYCFYQYCMVYHIQTGGRIGGRILSNSRAIVLHQGGPCRWARGGKGWLILHKRLEGKEYLVKANSRLQASRIGLHKRLYFCETVMHESTIRSFPPPTCIARPDAIVLHDYWAVYDSPSELSSSVCYAPYNIGHNNNNIV